MTTSGNKDTYFELMVIPAVIFYIYTHTILNGKVRFHHWTILPSSLAGIFLVFKIVLFRFKYIAQRKKYPFPLPIREFLAFLVRGVFGEQKNHTDLDLFFKTWDLHSCLKIFLIKKKYINSNRPPYTVTSLFLTPAYSCLYTRNCLFFCDFWAVSFNVLNRIDYLLNHTSFFIFSI